MFVFGNDFDKLVACSVATGTVVFMISAAVVAVMLLHPPAADATPVFNNLGSGVAVDVQGSAKSFQLNSAAVMRPASTLKTVTAGYSLYSLGPDYRPTTYVVVESDKIILVGAADPTLTTNNLKTLARRTRKVLPTLFPDRSLVRLYYDDYLFKSVRPKGWPANYTPDFAQVPSPLSLHDSPSSTPALHTAKLFSNYIDVKLATTPRYKHSSACIPVASFFGSVTSADVKTMLYNSDNHIAEMLMMASASKRLAGTESPVSRVRARQDYINFAKTISGQQTWFLFDGSGLSRKDRLSAQSLSSFLNNLSRTPYSIRPYMPSPGKGTLLGRFSSGSSKKLSNRVVAKTGSLFDTISLAGYVDPDSSSASSFVVLVDRPISYRNGHPVRSRLDGALAKLFS